MLNVEYAYMLYAVSTQLKSSVPQRKDETHIRSYL